MVSEYKANKISFTSHLPENTKRKAGIISCEKIFSNLDKYRLINSKSWISKHQRKSRN